MLFVENLSFYQESSRTNINVNYIIWTFLRTLLILNFVHSEYCRGVYSDCIPPLPLFIEKKQLLYSELADGSRKRGRPKLRYKDTLKASLKSCLIDPDKWEQSASDRAAWRHQVWKGVSSYELNSISKRKEQRRKRKEKESNRARQ